MGVAKRASNRKTLLVAALACLLVAPSAITTGAVASSPDDPASLLWPQPRQVQPAPDSQIRLPIQIIAPPELTAPAALLRRQLEDLFGPGSVQDVGRTALYLGLAPQSLTRPEEYAVQPYPGGVALWSHDTQGAFWAVHTLATLLGQAQPAADGYTAAIPALRDWPDTQFRALMFQGAWVPTLEDYRRTLELMARMHITYFALEFGPQVVLDFDPAVAEGGRFSKADARAVIAYGRSLGLKPIGYLNMLGHLDRAYQKDPYTQHGGIDIRNDETYDKFVYPILQEMLDVYGPLEYFHCGMDEAWELFRWLSEEKYDVTSLIARHIERVDDFLKRRGVKLVIWHDMLIAPTLSDQIGGPAGPANGGPPQNTAAALASIPKDVVLDYWFYDPLPAYPALDYLQAQGFEVWASPWETPFSFVRYANSRRAPTLGTMWSGPPGCFADPRSSTVIAFYAQAAWNASAAGPEVAPEEALRPAAQRATSVELWRRRTLAMPGARALVLTPNGPRPASPADELSYGIPLASEQPVLIEPLPDAGKPLDLSASPARVRVIGGADLALDGVNAERGRGQLILYAAPRERTGANSYGTEVLVGADGAVLEVAPTRSGDHAVPPGGFVLSAAGGRGKGGQLRALHTGDRVAVLDAQGRWIGGSEPLALTAELPAGRTVAIGAEDTPREAGQVVLYHSAYGEGRTQTDANGVEVVVRGGKVTAVSDGAGDSSIPEDGYVLSAASTDGGQAAAALAALRPGDAIRLLVAKGGRQQYLDDLLHDRSKRFPVGARCAALYLAVTSDRRCPPGARLGEWAVRYADGTTETIPCRYGRQALSADPDALPITLTDPVWLADQAGRRFLVQEWRNPHPDLTLSELVFAPDQAVLQAGARVLAATAAVQ